MASPSRDAFITGSPNPASANACPTSTCVTKINNPAAKHPPRSVRPTASPNDPSNARLSYALAASAPHTHIVANFAPCAIAGNTYAAPRHDGPKGVNHDGRVPVANAAAATTACADVATSASAIGNPRSALDTALGVNRGRISVAPNSTPRLNSASTSTDRSTNDDDDDDDDASFSSSSRASPPRSDDDARRTIDRAAPLTRHRIASDDDATRRARIIVVIVIDHEIVAPDSDEWWDADGRSNARRDALDIARIGASETSRDDVKMVVVVVARSKSDAVISSASAAVERRRVARVSERATSDD
jgi:hypothetical protein